MRAIPLHRYWMPVVGVLLLCLAGPAHAGLELGQMPEALVESLAAIIGGVGLFLVGIEFSGPYLQRLAGSRLTDVAVKIGENPFGVVSGGLLLGALTQSGKASAFILSDFVRAGMLPVLPALRLAFFGNVGAFLIVFVSMVNLKVFVLFLLGITGLGLTFRKPPFLHQAYGLLFGLGMVMYGLYLVKVGATGLASTEGLQHVLAVTTGSYLLSFLLGFALTLLFQSNVATSLLMIALVSAGLFDVPESLMAIFGAQSASALLTYLFSFHVKGRARQVVIGQMVFDAVVTWSCVLLFCLEMFADVPLLISASQVFFATEHAQMIALILATQAIAAAVMALCAARVLTFIVRYIRPTAVEVLGEPRYVNRQLGINSATTALLLIAKEQVRLLERVPQYLDAARSPDEPRSRQPSPAALHEACGLISMQVSESLAEISSQRLGGRDADRVVTTTKLQEQIVQLDAAIYRFSSELQVMSPDTPVYPLAMRILESLDFMVLSAIDALQSRDRDEVDILSLMLGDRTAMMADLRDNYFGSQPRLTHEQRSFLFDITLALEHTVQILSRLCTILKSDLRHA